MALDLSTILPALPPEEKKRETLIKEKVKERAFEKKIVTREEELVIRDILPATDLGFSAEDWSKSVTASANNWGTYVDKTLDDDEAITFTGIVLHDPNPVITAIRFKLGAAVTKAVFSLTKAYVLDQPIILFRTPIKYDPKDRIVIEVYTTTANPTVKIELLGYKVEKIGKTVGEKKTS